MGGVAYYDKIADLYDITYNEKTGCDHMAQVEWVDGWREKLALPRTVLDLACGTGRHLVRFEELGYACHGIDASVEMLKIAARSLTETRVEQGFFHSFKLRQQVPLVTCFFNALSYCRDLDELGTAVENVRRNLLDGGLFIFDIYCPTSPQRAFSVKTFARGGLQFSRTFVGFPTAEGYRSTMYVIVFDGSSSRIIEETTLRGVFSESGIAEVLISSGLDVLYTGHGYTSESCVFVAQKPL